MIQTVPIQPPVSYSCWSDGTKAQVVTNASGSQVKMTATFQKVGSCYSLETTSSVPANSISYVWKTSDGTLVAQGASSAATPNQITVICAGRTYMVDTGSSVCQGKTVIPACTTVGNCSL